MRSSYVSQLILSASLGFTGYTGGFQQQQQAQQPSFQQPAPTGFNAIASIPPPQPQENPNKYAPSNIFAAMKKQEFGQPEEQQPQQSSESHSLRWTRLILVQTSTMHYDR